MKETILKAIALIVCAFLISSAVTNGIDAIVNAETSIADYQKTIDEYKGGSSSNSGNSGGLGALIGAPSDGGSSNGGSTDAGTSDGGSTDADTPNGGAANGGQQQAQLTKADVIKLLNETTTQAAKGTYKVNRGGKFVKNIDVGNATGALNKIIQGVDKNADLNSVVGGFLGIRKDPITGTATNGKYEGFEAKYALKGMTLTEADVTDFAVNGNKYAVQLVPCKTPNANSAIARATNDYITFAEVNKGISDSVGSAVKVVEGDSTANYTKIIFIATIVDGKITELEYSYTLNAKLKIQLAVIGATGTGEADITGKYTEIKY